MLGIPFSELRGSKPRRLVVDLPSKVNRDGISLDERTRALSPLGLQARKSSFPLPHMSMPIPKLDGGLKKSSRFSVLVSKLIIDRLSS